MATADNSGAKPRKPKSLGRVWGIRILVATVIGVTIGAVTGVVGVNTLEPGRPGQADSLQLLLDSLARTETSAQATPASVRDTAPAQQAAADSIPSAVVAVPDLTDFEEGRAREALEEVGFEVGTVMFRASRKPAGTVLSTFPVAGERVALPATVNLVLSDGRGVRDSVPEHSRETR